MGRPAKHAHVRRVHMADSIEMLVACTGLESAQAALLLEASGGNLEVAVQLQGRGGGGGPGRVPESPSTPLKGRPECIEIGGPRGERRRPSNLVSEAI